MSEGRFSRDVECRKDSGSALDPIYVSLTLLPLLKASLARFKSAEGQIPTHPKVLPLASMPSSASLSIPCSCSRLLVLTKMGRDVK